jgi:hypothetical protein
MNAADLPQGVTISYVPVPLVPSDGTKDDQERFRSTLLPPHGTRSPVGGERAVHAKAGDEHASERTRMCVSERAQSPTTAWAVREPPLIE